MLKLSLRHTHLSSLTHNLHSHNINIAKMSLVELGARSSFYPTVIKRHCFDPPRATQQIGVLMLTNKYYFIVLWSIVHIHSMHLEK